MDTPLTEQQKLELTELFKMSMHRAVTVLRHMEPYATELEKLDQDDLEGLQKLADTITWHDKCVFLEGILTLMASTLEKQIPWLKEYVDFFNSEDEPPPKKKPKPGNGKMIIH